jgi:CubicO group peptidase (beta-lactamase class C family)
MCCIFALLLALLTVTPSSQAGPAENIVRVDAFLQSEVALLAPPHAAYALVVADDIHVRCFDQKHGWREDNCNRSYLIASNTKAFTALATVRLSERGQIDLDQPVGSYIKGFKTKDPRGSQITVRHLMNHSSGLTRALGLVDMYGDIDFRDHLDLVADTELHAAPGERYQYSNANYWLLSMVLEDVTGQSYETVLDEQVLQPLGMKNSSVVGKDTVDPPFGHRYWFGSPKAFDGRFSEKVVASTPSDMASFLSFHLGDGTFDGEVIVEPAGLALLHTPPEGLSYAGGWKLKKMGEVGLLRHSGASADFRCEMFVVPDAGVGAVLFFDAYHELASDDFRYIAQATAELLVDGKANAQPPEPRFAERVVGGAFVLGILALVPALGLLVFPWWRRRMIRSRSKVWQIFSSFRPIVLCLLTLVLLPVGAAITGVPLNILFTFIPDLSLLILAGLGLWLVLALLKVWAYVSMVQSR